MLYTSTRDRNVQVTSAQAITHGISAEGGLFVPQTIPTVTPEDLVRLSKMDYKGRAKEILSLYLTDFTAEEIAQCVDGAYADGKFSSAETAPLVKLSDSSEILELWRGPTCAFKDMALQLLPYLLTVAAGKAADGKQIVILVATSGDTGKAALEGFKNVRNTQIMVFYPSDGVSPMQKLQMATQEGDNVMVCAIEGNFDDAQSGVKKIFTDPAVAAKLAEKNKMFSSANSINWGRLVPQIVYYVSAYCDMLKKGEIRNGDPVNVVVPTGNFGNILAAYYAKQMGVPLGRLICASNKNKVLTDFIETGVYDRRRDFYCTSSPSMDILISSNLERLLFLLSDMDDKQTAQWMQSLSKDGVYNVGAEMHKKITDVFSAGFCDEDATQSLIRDVYQTEHYLCDTHTAVAVQTYRNYKAETGDSTPTVIASTASPYKFSKSVLHAIAPQECMDDEFAVVERLHEITGFECPKQLLELKDKTVRFTDCCAVKDMEEAVLRAML